MVNVKTLKDDTPLGTYSQCDEVILRINLIKHPPILDMLIVIVLA